MSLMRFQVREFNILFQDIQYLHKYLTKKNTFIKIKINKKKSLGTQGVYLNPFAINVGPQLQEKLNKATKT